MSLIHTAYAQINNPVIKNGSQQVSDPTGYVNSVFQTVISIFFVVGIVYFLWHFIFAGFHFIATDGDAKKYETAKNEIMHAFIGLIVMFSVFAILKFIGYILGIQGLTNLTIPLPSL